MASGHAYGGNALSPAPPQFTTAPFVAIGHMDPMSAVGFMDPEGEPGFMDPFTIGGDM